MKALCQAAPIVEAQTVLAHRLIMAGLLVTVAAACSPEEVPEQDGNGLLYVFSGDAVGLDKDRRRWGDLIGGKHPALEEHPGRIREAGPGGRGSERDRSRRSKPQVTV